MNKLKLKWIGPMVAIILAVFVFAGQIVDFITEIQWFSHMGI